MPQLAPPVAQVGSNGPKRHMRVAPSPHPADDKSLLRKALRAKRRGLPTALHASRSALATRYITRLPEFASGRRVALTLSFDREIDTAALIAAARRRGVRLYSPVIVDKRHSRLRFYPLDQ